MFFETPGAAMRNVRKPQVIAALEQSLAPFVRADGLWAPSSTWFVTATNPR